MSFFDVHIIRKNKTFITSVYRKPTFSRVYTHFDSFLPSSDRFGTVCASRLQLFSNMLKLNQIITFSETNYLKSGCPENFINKCFKRFTDNILVVKGTALRVEKKLVLIVSNLGSTKLKKSLKTFLIVVKCKRWLKIRQVQVTTFISQIGFSKILLLVSFKNFSVDSAMSPIMINVLDN